MAAAVYTRREVLGAHCGALSQRLRGRSKTPNVLFIVLDDLNDWVGCLGGYPGVRTPHMDRLARQGMLFTNAHCCAPICNPSRTALFSGVPPADSGIYHNMDRWCDSAALRNAVPLPRHFRDNGYRTMSAGKVFHANAHVPAFEGIWDEDAGTAPGGRSSFKPVPGEDPWKEVPHPHAWALRWGPVAEEHQVDPLIAGWAAERLRRTYKRPFFLAVGFHRPHAPLTAPQSFFDLYPPANVRLPKVNGDDLDDIPPIARQIAFANAQDPVGGFHHQITRMNLWREVVRAYLASISFADACVGTVLEALFSGPNAGNTLVVLLSDNGWSLGEKQHWQKWSLWEEATRCPLMMLVPGLKPGRCSAPVSFIDVYPTLTDLCGLPRRQEHQGRALRALLEDPSAAWNRPALTTFGAGNHSVRSRCWRYTRYVDGSEELYDHRNDPDEWRNLASAPGCEAVKRDMERWLPRKDVPATASYRHADVKVFGKRGTQVNFGSPQPGIAGRPIAIGARIRPSVPGTTGVIYHHGNMNAAFALYVKAGRLAMAVRDIDGPPRWDTLRPRNTVVEAGEPLPLRWLEVEGRLSSGGVITLKIDGKPAGSGRCGGLLSLDPTGVISVGQFGGPFVPAGDYAAGNAFHGEIEIVTVRYGP